jgi:hypothetical protein
MEAGLKSCERMTSREDYDFGPSPRAVAHNDGGPPPLEDLPHDRSDPLTSDQVQEALAGLIPKLEKEEKKHEEKEHEETMPQPKKRPAPRSQRPSYKKREIVPDQSNPFAFDLFQFCREVAGNMSSPRMDGVWQPILDLAKIPAPRTAQSVAEDHSKCIDVIALCVTETMQAAVRRCLTQMLEMKQSRASSLTWTKIMGDFTLRTKFGEWVAMEMTQKRQMQGTTWTKDGVILGVNLKLSLCVSYFQTLE